MKYKIGILIAFIIFASSTCLGYSISLESETKDLTYHRGEIFYRNLLVTVQDKDKPINGVSIKIPQNNKFELVNVTCNKPGWVVEYDPGETTILAYVDKSNLSQEKYAINVGAYKEAVLRIGFKIKENSAYSRDKYIEGINTNTDFSTVNYTSFRVTNLTVNYLVKADKSELEELIEKADTRLSEHYTDSSFDLFTTALTNAKLINDNLNATDEQVQAEIISLKEALNNLVADKTALVSLIAYSKTFSSTDYTTTSYNNLTSKIAEAENINNTSQATLEQVTLAATNLQTAIDTLIPLSDKTKLDEQIKRGEKILVDKLYYKYTEEFKMLPDEIIKAKLVYDNSRATQTQINLAADSLEVYINTYVVLSRDIINSKILEANQYNVDINGGTTPYTTESAQALIDQKTRAQNLANRINNTPQLCTVEEVKETLTNIDIAIAGLIAKPLDKTELSNLITYAKKYDQSLYTSKTAIALKDAITYAENMYTNATIQTEILNSLYVLDSAIYNLELTLNAKKPLLDRITSARAKDVSMYTNESVNAFYIAINSGEAMYKKSKLTIEEMNSAITYINTKESALTQKKTDKTLLNEKISEIEGLNIDYTKYTKKSGDKLKIQLANAKKVSQDNLATQEIVNSSLLSLEEAYKGLVLKEDVTALSKKVEDIDAEFKGVYTDFTENTANAIKVAMQEAKSIIANDESTRGQIEEAFIKLNTAYDNLETNVDKTKLKTIIEKSELIDRSIYTTVSVNKLDTELEKAKEIFNKKRAIANEVLEATTNLQLAYDSLEVLGTKTALKKRVDEIQSEFNGIYKEFTENTANAIKVAMQKADEVLNKTEVTEKEITEALSKLNEAYNNLETNVDKTALKEKVAEINNKFNGNYTGYTAESVTILKNALSNANSIIDNKRATKENISSALENLNLAYNNLKLEVDKTKLISKINSFVNIDYSKYTSVTANALKAAIEAGNIVLNNSNATQKNVDDALFEIEKAEKNLVEVVDKTELKAEIDRINKEFGGVYTEFTKVTANAIKAAMTNANLVVSNQLATKDEVNTALKNLKNAYNSLESNVNKTKLKSKIDSLANLNYESYTTATVIVLKEKINLGKITYNTLRITQIKVDNALSEIESAEKKLVKRGDKTALNASIRLAQSKNLENYTKETSKILKEKLSAAILVRDNIDSTKEDIKIAKDALDTAISSLVVSVDKAELLKVIKDAETIIDLSPYTIESTELFTKMLIEAKKIAADENSTQEQINIAKSNLINAKNNLVIKPVDKIILKAEIVKAEKIDTTLYTEDSVSLLKDAIVKAKIVLEKTDATDKQVQDAYNLLVLKLNSLELKNVDKTELKDLLVEVEKIDQSKYTKDTVEVLRKEIEKARAVINNDLVTKYELDTIKSSLQAAINKLVLNQNSDDNNNNENGNIVNTGNHTIPIVVIVIISIVILINIIYFIKKRRNKNIQK